VNYLAHARNLVDRPWEVVGAALPDWLRLLDPRVRLRAGAVSVPPETEETAPERQIARGIRIHHEEDRRFHGSAAFRDLTRTLARRIRTSFPDRPARRMRASFFAHVLTEVLLDAELVRRRPELAEAWYAALDSLSPEEIASRSRRLVPGAGGDLAGLVRRFRTSRFLARSPDDDEVVARLDSVGRRLRQPPLPAGFAGLVAPARALVAARTTDLLARAGADAAPGTDEGAGRATDRPVTLARDRTV
jgi:hypothetical protein